VTGQEREFTSTGVPPWKSPVALSVALHLLIVGVALTGWSWSSPMQEPPPSSISARLITQQKPEPSPVVEPVEQPDPDQEQKDLEKQKQIEVQKRQKQKEEEARKVAEQKKREETKRKAEEQKKAEERKARETQEAEAARQKAESEAKERERRKAEAEAEKQSVRKKRNRRGRKPNASGLRQSGACRNSSLKPRQSKLEKRVQMKRGGKSRPPLPEPGKRRCFRRARNIRH
jgi:colicin import membrane protein